MYTMRIPFLPDSSAPALLLAGGGRSVADRISPAISCYCCHSSTRRLLAWPAVPNSPELLLPLQGRAPSPSDGPTELDSAAAAGHLGCLRRLVEPLWGLTGRTQAVAWDLFRRLSGAQALYMAAAAGQYRTAEFLVRYGCRVWEETLLATVSDRTDMRSLLLHDQGRQIDYRYHSYYVDPAGGAYMTISAPCLIPLPQHQEYVRSLPPEPQRILFKPHPPRRPVTLEEALETGQPLYVESFLRRGVHLTSAHFHRAAAGGSPRCVRLLLDHGCPLDRRALLLAVASGCFSLLPLLTSEPFPP